MTPSQPQSGSAKTTTGSKRWARQAASRFERGETLPEALITLLVMSIGLLGMAALQLTGVQENASALRHSQATWLAYNMADRMRANLDHSQPAEDIADHYDGIDVSAGTAATGVSCGAGDDCNFAQMANFDSDEWRNGILPPPDGQGMLPQGRGMVAESAVNGRFFLRVLWKDDASAAADANAGCPSGAPAATPLTCVEIALSP